MSKLQTRIEEAAGEFARRVVEMVRQVTIDELAGFLGAEGRTAAAKKPPFRGPKRPPTETPRQREARKIQGSYIGLLRKFPPKEKLVYKAIAKKSGVAEAVLAMKKKLGRI